MFGCAGPVPTLQVTVVEGGPERLDQGTEPVREDKVGAVPGLNLAVFPHISMERSHPPAVDFKSCQMF